jgi:uncharacterized protein YgiM (DUF1202 family)
MKTNYWMVLGVMLATSVIAQQVTKTAPGTAAPATATPAESPQPAMGAPAPAAAEANVPAVAPAKKSRKHKTAAAEKIPLTEPTVMLVSGPATVAVSNINVRGQASLKGEVVAHLFKDDAVTVLEQINLQKHKADEPAQWAKIAFPEKAHVWVSATYIDATNKTVLPRKLNLRSGPGENYSVVGLIERGTSVNEISSKGNWMEIETPKNAYAFVAAMYLKQEAPTAPVPETGAMAAAPTTEPAAPPVEQAPPPRIVQHEGVVRHVTSLIVPTDYELYDPATGKIVDFLYPTSPDLDLSKYSGYRIVVTGEEGLDPRWKDTPVIAIQHIDVISSNVAPKYKAVPPHSGHRR